MESVKKSLKNEKLLSNVRTRISSANLSTVINVERRVIWVMLVPIVPPPSHNALTSALTGLSTVRVSGKR